MTTTRTPSRLPSRVRVPAERQKRIKVHTCVDADTEAALLAWCEHHKRSMSDAVRSALETMLAADARARRRASVEGVAVE